MSNAKVYQFNFEKTYKEVEINGKMFRVEFNDEAQNKYRKAYKKYVSMVDDMLANAPDFEKDSDEKIDAFDDKQREVSAFIIDTFLGDGSFPEIYEMAGRSVFNLKPLIEYITDLLVTEEQAKEAQAITENYLKNGKK